VSLDNRPTMGGLAGVWCGSAVRCSKNNKLLSFPCRYSIQKNLELCEQGGPIESAWVLVSGVATYRLGSHEREYTHVLFL